LGARIVSVCDAFDAMISARPYSTPRTTAEAVQEINRCAGRQFDPAVVACFDDMMMERRTLLSRNPQAVSSPAIR
jgi:HD-GYP domain-containing protein (c-di-GMP phosphodiesterase class II)